MKKSYKINPVFKIIIYSIVIILLGFFAYLLYSNNNQPKMNAVKCNQKYGLCPAAKCIPNPFDSSQAYC